MAQFASLDQLLSKKARTKTVTMAIGDDEASITVRAIGAQAYDDLLAKHPPTKKQKADGATFNIDTFAPILLSLCMTNPAVTQDDAFLLWSSEDWARGELMDLFYAAVEVNNRGLDVPSNAPA